MINFFFQKKKKNLSDIPKWSFSDFKNEPETPFGIEVFFYQNLTYSYIVFWGEIYRELPCRRNH